MIPLRKKFEDLENKAKGRNTNVRIFLVKKLMKNWMDILYVITPVWFIDQKREA